MSAVLRSREVLCPWVGLPVHFLEPLDTRVRVDLGRRDRRVAEQFLHCAKVSAGVEQMRRELCRSECVESPESSSMLSRKPVIAL